VEDLCFKFAVKELPQNSSSSSLLHRQSDYLRPLLISLTGFSNTAVWWESSCCEVSVVPA